MVCVVSFYITQPCLWSFGSHVLDYSLLIVWMLVSYVPQYARIVARQSAEGLSTLYILLGSMSGICAVANILILPASQVDIGCCRNNNTFACVAGLLGMVQVITGVSLFWGV